MKLREVIEALNQRGRHEEAIIYGTLLPMRLFLQQGLSEKQVLNMELDEIEAQMRLPEKPLKYADWDTFIWGEAAFQES